MQVSAKSDYALRALAELAVSGEGPVKGERISCAQEIPLKFLEAIMLDLKRAGLVTTQRGPAGGYRLALPPTEITLADAMRAVDGPLANVHGIAPEDVRYHGAAAALREVWVAVRASLREVLEHVTVADLASADLPPETRALISAPEAWERR